MFWFKRGSKRSQQQKTAVERSAIVEIEAAKDASRKAFAEAEAVGNDLNKLLVENGFTLKIYLATGGKIDKENK